MSAMKAVGYGAFFIGVVVLSLYWSFPWDAAKERALTLASERSGMRIEADDVSPSWGTGIVARGVRIRTKSNAEPIVFTEVTARAQILPLLSGGRGVSLDFPIARGEVDVSVVHSDEILSIEGEARGLELGLIEGLAEATGAPLGGRLSLTVDVDLGVQDPKQSTGQLEIVGEDLEILKGGKVPDLTIGNLNWSVPIKDGVAKLDKLRIEGDDAEVELDGDITLDKVPKRSRLNLTVRYKPSAALTKRHPIINIFLNNPSVRRSKGSDGFFQCRLRGVASRINKCSPITAGR